MSQKILLPQAQWPVLLKRMQQTAPEVFDPEGNILNLIGGQWSHAGHGKHFHSPLDGSHLADFPQLNLEEAKQAVHAAASEAEAWARVDLDKRRAMVTDCIQKIRAERELIAFLLTWEIGKPYHLSLVDVDRCLTGVEWYVENIESLLGSRKPLGAISNIASWNYPLSVLMHAVLVQVLSGNAAIAKTPSDGGLCALTVSFAIARRCGLPVTLVSGSGGQLSEALVRNDDIACLAFVGGKTNGRDIAASLVDKNKRYMLEMEGVNAFGIWNYSDWEGFAKIIKKGFEYGKQRCTAYARYVIQRELFPQFLEMYIPVLKSLKFGHPLLVDAATDLPPALDFGPLINYKKVEELRVMYSEAIGKGAVGIFEGKLDESLFLPHQDISSYLPPISCLNLPRNCSMYHHEPFGPLDSIVLVDRVEELIAEMNVSGGCLVASVMCDDPKQSQRIGKELRSFKVGYNAIRSRGDREESFGGRGESWKGCFVGGKHLVHAVTEGAPGERLCGNFEDYSLLPDKV